MRITEYVENWSVFRPGIKLVAQDDTGRVMAYLVCEPDRVAQAREALETILKPKGDAHGG